MSILLLDNFDSFTYNLVDYFEQLGIHAHVFRNNIPLEKIIAYQYDAVVLSPGPSNPANSGNLLAVIDYYHQSHPVLGICLGHQAIGCYFGATISELPRPMHGKFSTITIQQDPIFKNLKNPFRAVRYHSLVLSHAGKALQVLAKSEDGAIMALRHKHLAVYGLQFHPEAVLTDHGLEILKNWASLNHILN